MKRKVFLDRCSNGAQKKNIPIFEELDKLVNCFGMTPNMQNQRNQSGRNEPTQITMGVPLQMQPTQKPQPRGSKSHLINTSRVNISSQIRSSSKNKNDFNLDDVDLEQYFDTPPVLIKNNQSQNHLNEFPLNYIIKHQKLNNVQQDCFNLLFNTNKNSLITAPTGSGKTVLFEIAIGRVIKQNFNLQDHSYNNKKFTIIYLAPIKSLCQEKTIEWKSCFSRSPLDLTVMEATGDSEFINMNQLSSANIILTTPERFDVLTRKWKENPQFVSQISLLLIDEVHLLNEECRGATIEAIVARMKLLSTLKIFSNSELSNYRIIALSATIPNIPEVAEFLKVDDQGLKIFGEEYRPVQIERIVLGYAPGKGSNEYMFEKYLDYRVSGLIQKYSEGKPVLVFCQTQKGTINSAKQLVADMNVNKMPVIASTTQERMKLESLSNRISNKQLSQVVRYGIAFHNAGLSLSDRQMIEDNFKACLIKVICTTSTLAQGVNLPARLVIIKSTNCYRGPKIGYTEYNKMEIDQMAGRAGRPQYDNKGIAIIMTEKEKVDKFYDLDSTMIESHLKENIVEHINAEIASGSIVDIDSAVNWITNTFMFVRMKNSPNLFGIRIPLNKNKLEVINGFLQEMCVKIFKDLEENSLIVFNKSNNTAQPKSLCRKMSKNYVMFDTMKIISQMAKDSLKSSSLIEETLINILSNSKEFSKYNSKIDERKTLNTLNKEESGIKFKLKGSIDTSVKKAYILLQSSLSGIVIDHWELRRQQNEITQSSMRILNCLREYYKTLKSSKYYIACTVMKKCFNNGMWSDSELIMKQLPKIGEKLARAFIRAGVNSFDKLIHENPRRIESICGKNSPFGNILIDVAKSIPVINLQYDIVNGYKGTWKMTLTLRVPWEKYIQDDFDSYTCYHVIVCDIFDEMIFKKKIRPSSSNKNIFFSIQQITNKQFPLRIYMICDKFIGMDKIVSITDCNDKTGNFSGTRNIMNILCSNKTEAKEIPEDVLEKLFDGNPNMEGNEPIADENEATQRRNKNYNKRKRGKRSSSNNARGSSVQRGEGAPSLLDSMSKNYGNHKDLKEMLENMRTEKKEKRSKVSKKEINKEENPSINVTNQRQSKGKENGYNLNSTNAKTPLNLNSTQNLLEHLKQTKPLELDYNILDNITQNPPEGNKPLKNIFNLNLDDIL